MGYEKQGQGQSVRWAHKPVNGTRICPDRGPSQISERWKGPLILLPYGLVTAFWFNVTSVCAKALPFNTALVFSEISV
jgi:RNA polymerase subunit RPABC4/transcription elongation factor Spt4